MKTCNRCHVSKALEEFNKDYREDDKHTAKCRKCIQMPNEREVKEQALFTLRNSYSMGKL